MWRTRWTTWITPLNGLRFPHSHGGWLRHLTHPGCAGANAIALDGGRGRAPRFTLQRGLPTSSVMAARDARRSHDPGASGAAPLAPRSMPATATPAIRCGALVKRYGAVTAVDGLDLEVGRGEC